MLELAAYTLSYYQIVLLIIVALFIGMAKTGAYGMGMVAVPLLVIVFGAKQSTGVLLPMLIMADFFAVYYYSQHADWYQLRRLIPTSMLGILIGTYVGQMINDHVFLQVIAVTLVVSLGIMIWRELNELSDVPSSSWWTNSIGILGGFTSMVGNLAGPVMALYLLSMRLPKNQFIGTAAWFFLVINVAKVPFHIWVWETIDLDSLILNISMLPVITIGAVLGIVLIKRVPEKPFRWFVITMVGASAAALMI